MGPLAHTVYKLKQLPLCFKEGQAALAQLVEYVICNLEVIGSIPVGGSIMYNALKILLGIIFIPIVMVLLTPFVLPIFFMLGICALVSLILDIFQGKLTK